MAIAETERKLSPQEEGLPYYERAMRLKDDISRSFYELGAVIAEIRDRKLYQKMGRFSRETWDEYCAEYLGMHRITADKLAAVARSWPRLEAAATALVADPEASKRLQEAGVREKSEILNRATWSKLYQIATIPDADEGELKVWLLKALILGRRDLMREVARRRGRREKATVNLASVEGEEVRVDPKVRTLTVAGEAEERIIKFTPQQWEQLQRGFQSTAASAKEPPGPQPSSEAAAERVKAEVKPQPQAPVEGPAVPEKPEPPIHFLYAEIAALISLIEQLHGVIAQAEVDERAGKPPAEAWQPVRKLMADAKSIWGYVFDIVDRRYRGEEA